MIKLPVFQQTSANFKYKIELELKSIEIQLIYNIRNGFFHFKFTDEEGTTLSGIKAVPEWPLLRIHHALVDFDGDFMIRREDINENAVLDYDNLGTDFNLYYMTEEEIEAWEADNGL